MVRLNGVQLDGVHDGGQRLLDHLACLPRGCVHLLSQLLAGALEAAFAWVLGLGVVVLRATTLGPGGGAWAWAPFQWVVSSACAG